LTVSIGNQTNALCFELAVLVICALLRFKKNLTM